MTYTPLPEGLTIRKSPIDNLGLFSDVNIEKGLNAGITHITDPITKKLYRTPLGGFINHSEEPNAKIVEVQRVRYLYFLRDIAPGEEITVKYTMYNPVSSKEEE
jgi:SET domain-containing protein